MKFKTKRKRGKMWNPSTGGKPPVTHGQVPRKIIIL